MYHHFYDAITWGRFQERYAGARHAANRPYRARQGGESVPSRTDVVV